MDLYELFPEVMGERQDREALTLEKHKPLSGVLFLHALPGLVPLLLPNNPVEGVF